MKWLSNFENSFFVIILEKHFDKKIWLTTYTNKIFVDQYTGIQQTWEILEKFFDDNFVKKWPKRSTVNEISLQTGHCSLPIMNRDLPLKIKKIFRFRF